MIIETITESLKNNPYFHAGFGLVGIGVGLTVLRKASQYGLIFLRRHYTMTLEVTSRDRSYYWLLQWMTQQQIKQRAALESTTGKRPGLFTRLGALGSANHLSVNTSFTQLDSGHVITNYQYIPAPGTHIFRYRNTFFRAERTRDKDMPILSQDAGASPHETLTLTALAPKSRTRLFSEMLDAARDAMLKDSEGRTIIYTPTGHNWTRFGHPRRPRDLTSVVLDRGVAQTLLSDLNEFLANYSWYKLRGVPYRRGYLLYGPPGCGKSSVIEALAGALHYSICILNVSDPYLTDDRLAHLLVSAPVQSFILLEDIDSACAAGAPSSHASLPTATAVSTSTTPQRLLSFSGLLNALDGVVSSEGRIVFMTTNHIDRLDAALSRPGRVDLRVKVDHCSDHQLAELFRRFYGAREPRAATSAATPAAGVSASAGSAKVPEADDALVESLAAAFVQAVRRTGRPASPAQVQAHFLLYKKDARAAVRTAETLNA